MSGISKYYYLNSYFNNPNDNMNQNTYFENRAGIASINKRSNKTPIIVNSNQFQKSNNNQGVHTNIWKKREIIGFSYLIDYFNLYKLGIYAPYNGFKKEFPESNIFNCLKENNIFCIEMTKVISCQLCGYNNTNTIYL